MSKYERILGAVGLLATLGMSSAEVLFEPVLDGPLVEHQGSTRGAAWGDLDGDGDADLYLTHPTYDGPAQRNALYRNDAGIFVPVESAASELPEAGWEGATWVDVDSDGDLDVHVVGRNGAGSAFLENDGAGNLSRRPSDPLSGVVFSASNACWADADLDGHLDVFIVGSGEDVNRLFRNHGDWTMEAVALPALGAGDGGARSCVWADLDRDRMPELVIANARQPNVLLRNLGGLTFVADTSSSVHEDEAYSYGISAADVNEDGLQDIFVANFDAGNSLYLGDSEGGLRQVELGTTLQSAASKGHSWGDFDLDGRVDLYLGSGTPRPGMLNRLYLGLGGGEYELVVEGPYASHADTSAAIASADYDMDGDLDLVVANWGSVGAVDRLYENTVSGRRWLRVRLEGVRSNRMGVGAHVSVLSSDADGAPTWQHRWLGMSTGYSGQNEPVIHFGLGTAEVVDSLVVRWPSGVVDRRTAVGPNQTLHVVEGR